MNPACTYNVRSEELTRGLCKCCYHRALRLVRDGTTTWERLEAEGKTRPKKQGGHNITPEAKALKPQPTRQELSELFELARKLPLAQFGAFSGRVNELGKKYGI